MRSRLILAGVAALLTLTACEDLNRREELVLGGLAGATIAVITAKALDADPDWTIIAALAGATIGTLVAIDARNDRCAYAMGGGRYRVVRCKR